MQQFDSNATPTTTITTTKTSKELFDSNHQRSQSSSSDSSLLNNNSVVAEVVGVVSGSVDSLDAAKAYANAASNKNASSDKYFDDSSDTNCLFDYEECMDAADSNDFYLNDCKSLQTSNFIKLDLTSSSNLNTEYHHKSDEFNLAMPNLKFAFKTLTVPKNDLKQPQPLPVEHNEPKVVNVNSDLTKLFASNQNSSEINACNINRNIKNEPDVNNKVSNLVMVQNGLSSSISNSLQTLQNTLLVKKQQQQPHHLHQSSNIPIVGMSNHPLLLQQPRANTVMSHLNNSLSNTTSTSSIPSSSSSYLSSSLSSNSSYSSLSTMSNLQTKLSSISQAGLTNNLNGIVIPTNVMNGGSTITTIKSNDLQLADTNVKNETNSNSLNQNLLKLPSEVNATSTSSSLNDYNSSIKLISSQHQLNDNTNINNNNNSNNNSNSNYLGNKMNIENNNNSNNSSKEMIKANNENASILAQSQAAISTNASTENKNLPMEVT